MRPRIFCLTDAEATHLQTAYQHCREAAAKIRYQAVRLYGTGYPVAQIGDICGCHPASLLEWARAYRERGLTALLDHHRKSLIFGKAATALA